MAETFADKAPTLAAAGVKETDVTAEVVQAPAEKTPSVPKPMNKQQALALVKWASVQGCSSIPAEKQQYAGKAVQDIAFAVGVDIAQAQQVLNEYRQATAPTAPVVKEPVDVTPQDAGDVQPVAIGK